MSTKDRDWTIFPHIAKKKPGSTKNPAPQGSSKKAFLGMLEQVSRVCDPNTEPTKKPEKSGS